MTARPRLPAIVQIHGPTRHGRAVWIPGGRLIAAAHCIEPGYHGLVTVESAGERFFAEVASLDRRSDCATLRRPMLFGDRPSNLKELYRQIRDDSVCFPLSCRPWQAEEGRLCRVFAPDRRNWLSGLGQVADRSGRPQLRVGLPVMVPRGSSGCPILDDVHELVSIVTHGSGSSAERHFAIGPMMEW